MIVMRISTTPDSELPRKEFARSTRKTYSPSSSDLLKKISPLSGIFHVSGVYELVSRRY